MSEPKSPTPVDAINPSHYRQGKVECIDAIEAALGPEGFVAFLRGQIIRYNWRLGLKDAPEQEAGKAKWYQDRLVQALAGTTIEMIRGAAPTDKKEEHGTANAAADEPLYHNGYTEYIGATLWRVYGEPSYLTDRFGPDRHIHSRKSRKGTMLWHYVES